MGRGRKMTPEREALRRDAIQMRRELGYSERRIAHMVNVPHGTIHDWLITERGTYPFAKQTPKVPGNSSRKVLGNSAGLGLGQVHVMDAVQGLFRLPSKSVSLIFADPPYNIGVKYGQNSSDGRPHDSYLRWCDEWFEGSARALKPGGSAYFMHYPEVCAQWAARIDKWFTVRRWITWHFPTNIGQSPKNWTRSSRTILYCTKEGPVTFNSKADPQPYRNPKDRRVRKRIQSGSNGVTPYDVWEYDLVKNVSQSKTSWPNQVPVPLVERIIKVSSSPGDLVCDPFMGSGTTAEAAFLNGREWIGFDVEEDSQLVTDARLERLRFHRQIGVTGPESGNVA